MAANLLQLIQDQLGSQGISALMRSLDGDESRANSAVSAGIAALVGGFMNKASTPSGLRALASTLSSFDDRVLADLPGQLVGSRPDTLTELGTHFVSDLFGGNLGAITGSLGRASGLSDESSGSMLAKLAPVAMGTMAKFMRSNDLDEDGLANLLGSQGQFLQSVLPSDLGNRFGLAGLGERAAWASSSATDVASAVGSEGPSWLRTAVPVLALLAVVWFGYQVLSGRGDDGQLPAVSARPPSASLVTDVLGDCTSALSGITDAQTARAALPAIEAANRAFDQVLAQSGTIPADARSAIARQAQDYLPQLQKLMAKAAGKPGASEVLNAQVAELMQKLSRAASI